MGHPLFDDNAPKQQVHVPLPAGREGSSKTPFSYRQARRYGQNRRWDHTTQPQTITLRLDEIPLSVSDNITFDSRLSGVPATTVTHVASNTDWDAQMDALAAAIFADSQYFLASYNSGTKRLEVTVSSGYITNGVVRVNGQIVSVD